MKELIKRIFATIDTEILRKIAAITATVACFVVLVEVAYISIAEIQTVYFHLFSVIIWLTTCSLGMWFYSVFGLAKSISEGSDQALNQAERGNVMKVHCAIIIASALLVFGTIFIYYGKSGDEIEYDGGDHTTILSDSVRAE